MDRLNATVEKNKNGGLIRKQRKEDGYMIEQIVAYNKKFVEEKGYEPYLPVILCRSFPVRRNLYDRLP